MFPSRAERKKNYALHVRSSINSRKVFNNVLASESS